MTEAWQPLPGTGANGGWTGPDPYLALAEADGFADHGGTSPARGWPVSVRLAAGTRHWPQIDGLQVRTGHEGSTHFTALASAQALRTLAAHGDVQRMQLAAAQVPRRPWPQPLAAPDGAAIKQGHADADASAEVTADADGDPPAPVLLGVIDDGCPFAHPALLRADGRTPRVLRLWNQDPAATSARGAPEGFDLGAEYTRADLERLRHAYSHRGAVDAAACHAAAGMPRLRHEASHGSHVLGLLAAARHHLGGVNVPILAPRGPLPPPDSDVPPSPGAAREADIAFVQLPSSVLQSVSVAALEHHAYDGLRYLCNLAVALRYRRLVVVLAYESWLGPHDGSSWFETAVDELLDTGPAGSAPAALRGLDVQLVMPAGNSRQRAVHAQVDTDDTQAAVSWQLPPGNEDPSFLELWAPNDAAALAVRITPPGGPPTPWLSWGQAWAWADTSGGQRAGVVLCAPQPAAGRRGQAVLRMAPTAALRPGAVAPAGTWRLEVTGPAGTLHGLHLRIGRVGPALAVPRRNRQPEFVGRTAEEANADRLHTLNGHACGQRVSVAGAMLGSGYPYLDLPAFDDRGRPRRYLPTFQPHHGRLPLRGHSAGYSGSGPTEGQRQRPDASLAVEDKHLWPGVLSLGTASASTFRLSGSSAAAPLWARELANRPAAAAHAAAASPPTANASLSAPVEGDPALGRQVRPD